MEGLDLSAMSKTWQDLAASEMRLHLMTELSKLKIGLAEVEEFNKVLKLNLRCEESYSEVQQVKFVKTTMSIKLRDEQKTNQKLITERNKKRRKLAEIFGLNTKPYRAKIKIFQEEARVVKSEVRAKYRDKIEHLQLKYRETEEEKSDKVPEEMEELATLSIFDREKFERIETKNYEVTKLGKVNLSPGEESILKLHPTFSVIQNLKENALDFEKELSYAKVRMERQKEIDEDLGEETVEQTAEEKEKMEELEAEQRQTFCPVNKIYNDRKRRVTDLQECSRVTLPKPLPISDEALIEIRREIHGNIYNTFRHEHCSKNGEQKQNLTEQEQKGLESLVKRISEEDLIIMKTDKSGKFCITTREEYKKMGNDHTKNDKVIGRDRIREIERILNGHCTAWAKIWGTGEDNGHLERVIDSKRTTSENLANLWLAYKDHKKEKGKSRPIATGCTSNTRGFSNSVSNLLESVANSQTSKFESISSEDMLSKTKESNKKMAELLEKWMRIRDKKLECKECNIKEEIEKKSCHICHEIDKEETEIESLQRQYDCEDCGEEMRDRLEQDCTNCGEGIYREEK